MRLHTKATLWLLPVIVPMLVFNLFQYRDQVDSLTQGIHDASHLAASAAADEVNGLLWLAENSFESLSTQIDECEILVDHADPDTIKQIDVALRTNHYFSLLGLVDPKGSLVYTQIAPIESNRHILPRQVSGEQLFPPQWIDLLEERRRDWVSRRAELSDQLEAVERELSELARIGQRNSIRYRELQRQRAQHSIVATRAPKNVFFGGGEVSRKAGLPFADDTYLFTAPVQACENQLGGYLVAFLDRSQIEDILFKYTGRLQVAGSTKGQVFLFDRDQERLLSSTRDISVDMLASLLRSAGQSYERQKLSPFQATSGGIVASARIADRTVLDGIERSYSSDEPIDHSRFHDIAGSLSTFSIVTYVPEDEIISVAITLLTEIGLWTLLSLLILIVIIALLTSKMVSPVTRLAHTMARVADGDLDARMETRSSDEIGNLVSVFNRMTSDLKQQRGELAKNLSLLQSTLQSTADGILVVDDKGETVLSNDRFTEMWSIPTALLQTRDDHKMLQHVLDQLQDPDGFLSKVQQVYADPEAISEDVLLFKDGRVFERFSMPQIEDGSSVGRVWSFRDVSKRRQAERERERLQRELQQSHKMEALGQLTGGVAHDFNNVLGIIMGNTELVLHRYCDEVPEKLISHLETVLTASARARDLVAKMLAFARPGRINARPLQMLDFIEENVDMLRSVLPSSMTIEFSCDKEIPGVRLEPSQLQQLLMNLCINARDAENGVGALAISLKWRRGFDDKCSSCHKSMTGEWVELSVADNGSGMTPESLERVFEPFYTTKDVGKGTGMGLPVVHGIMHSCSGHIVVESQPRQGTTFRLFFPPVFASSSEKPDTGATRAQAIQGGEERILVVDDETELADLIGEVLAVNGYQVTVEHDSSQALTLLQSRPAQFDLLVTDQTMPGLTGVELIRNGRKARPDLPAILCSGYSDVIDMSTAESMGIRYLAKPVNPNELIQTIEALLDQTGT